MKDRILQLLMAEGMTSMKFAEIMEVRPSNISHILSGRNNPGFDFIARLLRRFRDINPDWLINGEGDMYRTPVAVGVSGSVMGGDNTLISGVQEDLATDLVGQNKDNQDVNVQNVISFETDSVKEIVGAAVSASDLSLDGIVASSDGLGGPDGTDIKEDKSFIDVSVVDRGGNGGDNIDMQLERGAVLNDLEPQNDSFNLGSKPVNIDTSTGFNEPDLKCKNSNDNSLGSNIGVSNQINDKEIVKEPRKVLILYSDNTFEIYNKSL